MQVIESIVTAVLSSLQVSSGNKVTELMLRSRIKVRFNSPSAAKMIDDASFLQTFHLPFLMIP